MWRYTVKAVSSHVLLTADSLPDLPQRAPELIKYLGSCVWAVNMAKIPFEGVGPEPVAVGVEGDLVIMVLNKNPRGIWINLFFHKLGNKIKGSPDGERIALSRAGPGLYGKDRFAYFRLPL